MGNEKKDVTQLPAAQVEPTGGHGGGTGFSQEYVHELRQEAAMYRNKLREAEDVIGSYKKAEKDYEINDKVTAEFDKRGIKDVDPTWVDVADGQAINEAVDGFLEKHPNLKSLADNNRRVPEVTSPNRKGTPKPMGTEQPNSNAENRTPSDFETIKKDPVARSKLRDIYRGLLQQQNESGLTVT